MWSGTTDPDAAELDTLLKEGAPGKKNFTSWFYEKVIEMHNLYTNALIKISRLGH